MKLLKKEPKEFDKEIQKLLDSMPDERDKMNTITTLLGMCDNLCKFIMENYDPHVLPSSVNYSILQCFNFLNIFSSVIRSEKQEKLEIGGHLPVDEGAWKTCKDFEERLILLVKTFHEHFKKEGKL